MPRNVAIILLLDFFYVTKQLFLYSVNLQKASFGLTKSFCEIMHIRCSKDSSLYDLNKVSIKLYYPQKVAVKREREREKD